MSATAQSASFDCQKAWAKVEKTICSDPALSKLDDELAAAYKSALQTGDAPGIKAGQKSWLKGRNGCKEDTECLRYAYQARLKSLRLPAKLNACAEMTLVNKLTRFEGAKPGDAGGEVFVEVNSGIGFFIEAIAGLPKGEDPDKYMFHTQDFKEGDPLTVCLIKIPTGCPPGDNRGRAYSITNSRNKKSFSGYPDWHSCGGA
jgi:uncharacterized protein YecT (DUF1311 family)